ncbi:hypothetical protein LUW75_10820 [Streptomyces sp. MRC013]|uniref:hypothetical protein n=1 Tax=Streptomyces sp. MRC013 TaxID=2898276 RepID=UPI002025E724|nr:hypothetical protein [Streptomyces sp. MRC013]URM92849.1 hypothetical protein LUW75_10820 [Streptomyces sp. MRC013]
MRGLRRSPDVSPPHTAAWPRHRTCIPGETMRTRTTTVGIVAALALALTACSGSTTADNGTSPEPSLSAQDWDKAREAAGIPPKPTAEVRKAYLDALTAIHPEIIKPGKEDQAVSRGLNQCSSIKGSDDKAKVAQQALERFTITTRLPEIATPDTGKRLVDVVHTHLCPDF